MRPICSNVLSFLVLLFWCTNRGCRCTNPHNLHSLLKHPHYAQGHRHSVQTNIQNVTPYPQHKPNEIDRTISRPHSLGPTAPPRGGFRNDEPWTRVSPTSKEYYRMNGHKTPAVKNALVIDPKLAQELSEVREANEHFVRMRTRARCGVPRAQVVCVREVYPGKDFLPRCTLLHRCTDAAGCCEDDKMECAPRLIQEVVLHFYVLGDNHHSSDVEKLLFVNHTECECRLRKTQETTIVSTTVSTPEHQRDQQHKCRTCPVPFCVRELDGGICSCDCFDKHRPCLRIKKGREPLSDADRRCVDSGRCQVPDCEYGPYEADRGRCPRRPDNYEGHRKPQQPNHRNPNHRWTYFERD